METYLIPKNERKSSYYCKAIVEHYNNRITLYSYLTEVCYIENNQAFIKGLYSKTTTRHIKEFLIQNGFKVENSKQLLKDYGIK